MTPEEADVFALAWRVLADLVTYMIRERGISADDGAAA